MWQIFKIINIRQRIAFACHMKNYDIAKRKKINMLFRFVRKNIYISLPFLGRAIAFIKLKIVSKPINHMRSIAERHVTLIHYVRSGTDSTHSMVEWACTTGKPMRLFYALILSISKQIFVLYITGNI